MSNPDTFRDVREQVGNSFSKIDKDEDGQLSKEELTRFEKDGSTTSAEKRLTTELIHNFDDVRGLNDRKGESSKGIELADLDLLDDLSRETAIDRSYYEPSRKFALNNFEEIDLNSDGELTEFELENYRKNTPGQIDNPHLVYLEYRTSGNIANYATGDFSRITGLEGEASDNIDLSNSFTKENLKDSLERRIGLTQSSIYQNEYAKDWKLAGSVTGGGLGAAAGSFTVNPKIIGILGAGGAYLGDMAGTYYGKYRGANFYDQNQADRLKRMFN